MKGYDQIKENRSLSPFVKMVPIIYTVCILYRKWKYRARMLSKKLNFENIGM